MKNRKRIYIFIGIFLLLGFYTEALFAQKAVLEFGGKQGWGSIEVRQNIIEKNGRYGHPSLALAKPNSAFDSETDLYASFDALPIKEDTGNYRSVTESAFVLPREASYLGNGAMLCQGYRRKECVRFIPKNNRAFFAGGRVSSFSIAFWLYPERTNSEAVLFQWHGSKKSGITVDLQEISARFVQNKLEWSIVNIWADETNKGIDSRLRSVANVVPKVWSHHLLTYDEESGALEYRINGKLEGIVYMTTNGREHGFPFQGQLGSSADVLIAKHYAGRIDELRVEKKYTPPAQAIDIARFFEQHPSKGGYLRTMVMDTGGTGSIPQRLVSDVDLPPQTAVRFFIRAGNNRYEWTDDLPKWKAICDDTPIKHLQGRYIQLAARLYPDGTGKKSPRLNRMSLHYKKDRAPLPPNRVIAKAKNAAVKLEWSPSIDQDVIGYRIYVGDKKAFYFSDIEPLDVGNFTSYTVHNLENGKLYFFAIAARDKFGNESTVLSKEVWARPMPHCNP